MSITFGDPKLGYDANPPGVRADSRPASYDTRTVQGFISYGQAVFSGTTSAHCTRTPAAGTFLGIAVSQDAAPSVDFGTSSSPSWQTSGGYPENASCTYQQRGGIWVAAASAANAEDQVYVTPAGLITNVASGNIAIPARFESKVAAPGGPAILRVMA